MRFRVIYDLRTSTWHGYGHRMDVRASSEAHARALVERAIYARREEILAARHDDPGSGFWVTIQRVVPLPGEDTVEDA